MMKRIAISTLVLTVFFMLIAPLWALTNPNFIRLDRVNAYRSVVELNDLLVIATYEINYTTGFPTDPASDTFLYRLMDVGGSPQVAVNVPYPYNTIGYGEGVVSVYLTAAQVTAAGLVWLDALVVRLEGNPTFYTAPLVTTHTLGSQDYSSGSNDPANNRSQLANRILGIASDLQTEWGLDLLTSSQLGYYLNSTGELYFGQAIPGLITMAPAAYSVITTDPDVTARTYTNTGQTNAENRYAGVPWLVAWDTLNTDWGLPSKTMQSILVMVLVMAMLVLSHQMFGRLEPGAALSLMIVPLVWYMGFVPFQLTALLLFGVGMLAVGGIIRSLLRGAA